MNIVSAFEMSVRALLLWSCQAAVLVSMVWLILRLDRPHRPKERYKVWFTTLLIILLLSLTGRVAALLVEVRTSFEGQAPTVLTSGRALVATVTKPAKAALDRVSGVTATSLGLIWLLGAACGLMSRLTSYSRLQRIAVTAAPVCSSELPRIESDWRLTIRARGRPNASASSGNWRVTTHSLCVRSAFTCLPSAVRPFRSLDKRNRAIPC